VRTGGSVRSQEELSYISHVHVHLTALGHLAA
jgi:hypothetical protein